jgi:hypothetical protein
LNLLQSCCRLSSTTISTEDHLHRSTERYEMGLACFLACSGCCFAKQMVEERCHALLSGQDTGPPFRKARRHLSALSLQAQAQVFGILRSPDVVFAVLRVLPTREMTGREMSGRRCTSLLAAVLLLASSLRRARAVDSLPSYWTQGIATNYGGQQDGMVSPCARPFVRPSGTRLSAIGPWTTSFQLLSIMKVQKMASGRSSRMKELETKRTDMIVGRVRV